MYFWHLATLLHSTYSHITHKLLCGAHSVCHKETSTPLPLTKASFSCYSLIVQMPPSLKTCDSTWPPGSLRTLWTVNCSTTSERICTSELFHVSYCSRGKGVRRERCQSTTGTTRRPQSGERPGVDYNFVSTDEFKRLEKSGQFLESGVYEGNYYGTPKPPADPPGSSIVTSPSGGLNMRDGPPPPLPSHRGPPNLGPLPRNLGPLPGNWEIAYTDNNEKYFIE